MDWLKTELLTGFQKLLCLGLDRTPATDLIPGTVAAWLEAITNCRAFDQARDTPRIRAAFRTLAASRRTWPAPVDFLDALPRIADPHAPLRLPSDASRQRGLHAIRDLATVLHVELVTHHEMRMEERK